MTDKYKEGDNNLELSVSTYTYEYRVILGDFCLLQLQV